MQSVARQGSRAAPRLQRVLQHQQRRSASGGHQELTPQTPATQSQANESYGRGFYLAILLVPVGFALYAISRPSADGKDPYFTRFFKEKYQEYTEQNTARNAIHVEMIERAAADRTLFLNNGADAIQWIDHRYPESVNAGSPYNIPAGHGYAKIDGMIAKYQKQAYEENEKRLQNLRDNKIPGEQPFISDFTKSTPASKDS